MKKEKKEWGSESKKRRIGRKFQGKKGEKRGTGRSPFWTSRRLYLVLAKIVIRKI